MKLLNKYLMNGKKIKEFPKSVIINPTSPECSQPSLSKIFLVSMGFLKYPLKTVSPLKQISPLGSEFPVIGFLSVEKYPNSGKSTNFNSVVF